MILQALKEYYDRKAGLPRLGFEEKEIPYVIVLDAKGAPVDLRATHEGEGKKRRAKKYLVPQSVKRSVGIAANLLWDNPEYVLGIDLKGKPDRAAEQHAVFMQRVGTLGCQNDAGLLAVQGFMQMADKQAALTPFGETLKSLLDECANVTFQLVGDEGVVSERPAIQVAIANLCISGDASALCLVSGESGPIERLHTSIKGVRDAQSSGANIVSFNLDAFQSYGKKQGDNAPVGRAAAFAYTTAINHLLGRDSRQKLQVGDATTIFWASKDSAIETQFLDFFDEPPKDDPDRNTRAVSSLLSAPQTGAVSTDAGTTFYVLGLAPNASRIAIRFWTIDTVEGMSEKMRQHFTDIRIVHGPKDRDALSLSWILRSTALQGKSENIPPNVAGETMRAILSGLPYPQTLLQAAIRRLCAERAITYARAALIKACINRVARFKDNEQKEELKVSLDDTNTNTGYRLGRLFAALEKIQQEAHPGLNATIRDKFYGAASSTPVTVFGNLMRLKNHHLAKLENAGRRVNLERLLGQIMSGVNDFPSNLILADQGRFAIGYYHQMQDFYTKKEKTE
jgi:CRISPR-associated protein Csd1